MAGGIGSRFWPLSTPEYPKQFIDILGCGRTLIQLTVDRFKGVCPMEHFWVVTNAAYVDIVRQQLPDIPEAHILAELCVFLMNNYSGNETVNAGTGKELTIRELAETVAKVVGYEGKILWDASRPNGTPRKLLDVSKATRLGWAYKTELEDGIRLAYEDFLNLNQN